MEYSVKSIIIGRMKEALDIKDAPEDMRPVFIALYDINRPHTSGKAPIRVLEFVGQKVVLKGLNSEFLLIGKDVLVDFLEKVKIEENKEKGHIIVTGTQTK